MGKIGFKAFKYIKAQKWHIALAEYFLQVKVFCNSFQKYSWKLVFQVFTNFKVIFLNNNLKFELEHIFERLSTLINITFQIHHLEEV